MPHVDSRVYPSSIGSRSRRKHRAKQATNPPRRQRRFCCRSLSHELKMLCRSDRLNRWDAKRAVYLIETGVDVNTASKTTRLPIWVEAIEHGHRGLVQVALDHQDLVWNGGALRRTIDVMSALQRTNHSSRFGVLQRLADHICTQLKARIIDEENRALILGFCGRSSQVPAAKAMFEALVDSQSAHLNDEEVDTCLRFFSNAMPREKTAIFDTLYKKIPANDNRALLALEKVWTDTWEPKTAKYYQLKLDLAVQSVDVDSLLSMMGTEGPWRLQRYQVWYPRFVYSELFSRLVNRADLDSSAIRKIWNCLIKNEPETRYAGNRLSQRNREYADLFPHLVRPGISSTDGRAMMKRWVFSSRARGIEQTTLILTELVKVLDADIPLSLATQFIHGCDPKTQRDIMQSIATGMAAAPRRNAQHLVFAELMRAQKLDYKPRLKIWDLHPTEQMQALCLMCEAELPLSSMRNPYYIAATGKSATVDGAVERCPKWTVAQQAEFLVCLSQGNPDDDTAQKLKQGLAKKHAFVSELSISVHFLRAELKSGQRCQIVHGILDGLVLRYEKETIDPRDKVKILALCARFSHLDQAKYVELLSMLEKGTKIRRRERQDIAYGLCKFWDQSYSESRTQLSALLSPLIPQIDMLKLMDDMEYMSDPLLVFLFEKREASKKPLNIQEAEAVYCRMTRASETMMVLQSKLLEHPDTLQGSTLQRLMQRNLGDYSVLETCLAADGVDETLVDEHGLRVSDLLKQRLQVQGQGELYLQVDRADLQSRMKHRFDLYKTIAGHRAGESYYLFPNLRIQFIGEQGVDEGGLRNEFLTLMFRHLVQDLGSIQGHENQALLMTGMQRLLCVGLSRGILPDFELQDIFPVLYRALAPEMSVRQRNHAAIQWTRLFDFSQFQVWMGDAETTSRRGLVHRLQVSWTEHSVIDARTDDAVLQYFVDSKVPTAPTARESALSTLLQDFSARIGVKMDSFPRTFALLLSGSNSSIPAPIRARRYIYRNPSTDRLECRPCIDFKVASSDQELFLARLLQDYANEEGSGNDGRFTRFLRFATATETPDKLIVRFARGASELPYASTCSQSINFPNTTDYQELKRLVDTAVDSSYTTWFSDK